MIDSPAGRAIRIALEGTTVAHADIFERFDPEVVQRSIAAQARRIYEQQDASNPDDRERNEAVIYRSCEVGRCCELAVATQLLSRGLDVQLNDERASGSFGYDLLCEGLKVEVKSQRPTKGKDFFSFNDSRKVLNFCQSQFDLAVAVVPMVWADGKLESYAPWLLIDPRAIAPEAGLFVDSHYQGKYLKMNKAQGAGLMVRLGSL